MTHTDHVLTVTASEDDPDRRDYDVECPGVTDQCRAWQECAHPDSPPTRSGAGDLWDTHGVQHRDIDGLWMVPTDRCLIVGYDHLGDAAEYMTGRHWLPDPGRYPVTHDYVGDGEIVLFAAEVTA